MNIKGLLGNMITSPIRSKDGQTKVDRTIKSDSSHDRDANGQEFYGQNKKQQQQDPMSEEQFKKAVDYLLNLPSLKDNGWIVETIMEDSKRVLLVKDNSGNLIRRIPEAELWTLPFDKDVRTGQLLKKFA
jgi:uncharacterized FlaG/YvyC family protein